mmetsp:Transcript_34153/g.39417  ORF Transcript_34153/g.39417 Transcript_34153/m.39417 type:complete len:84 (+) Transcript_34153:201-452(+)
MSDRDEEAHEKLRKEFFLSQDQEDEIDQWLLEEYGLKDLHSRVELCEQIEREYNQSLQNDADFQWKLRHLDERSEVFWESHSC